MLVENKSDEKITVFAHGMQHYKPVEIFGGEEHFEMQQKLDAKKRELCKQHGIRLVEWKYDVPISAENFKLLGLGDL